jgi:tetratricopeptide (TPR) repeat protein
VDDHSADRIIEELRKQTRTSIWMNVVFGAVLIVLVLAPMIYFKTRDKNIQQKADVAIWTRINDANSRNDINEAVKILDELIIKYPNDYYLHSCIGSGYVQIRELEKAKKHFEISYKLFPIKDTKEKLDAINFVLSNK